MKILLILKNLIINYFRKLIHLLFVMKINTSFINNFLKFILLNFIYLFQLVINFYDNDNRFKFNSNLLSDDDLFFGFYRLLAVDNNIILPYNCFIRFLITSLDVLHSWAIPSLGVKLDACPGRLCQTVVFIKREGFFYGQCSEICGINHAFMPIVIEAIDLDAYLHWLKNPTPSATYFVR